MNNKTRRVKYLAALFLSLFLFSCNLISAGHGSFTRYFFNTSKANLETAVMKVIAENRNIYRELEASQEYRNTYKEIIKERNEEAKNNDIDTNYVDYYNDGKSYVTISINNEDFRFVFRYLGDEKEWSTSPNSEFFLVYINDKFGKGGGYKDNIDPKFVKRLSNVFEVEFVNKVAKI
jgi:hypothetical protein